MLMLTRRAGQSIKIGDDVTVTITDVDGKNVSVGIDAPKHVKVHREEIYDRIKNGEPRKVAEVAS